MDLIQFKSFIKSESAKAEEALQQAHTALAMKDSAKLTDAVCACIQHKFLLEELPTVQDDLLKLSEESTVRTLKLAEGNLQAADVSSGCVEADTADTKKILLLLMLKKRFALDLSPEEMADIDTVGDVCRRMSLEMNFPS